MIEYEPSRRLFGLFQEKRISRSRPTDPSKDVFNNIRMDEVLAMLMKDAVKTTGIRAKEINDVILGSAFQVGEQWMYGGRQPVLLAQLPVEVPAMALDRACSSSMNAITMEPWR
jgi:Acetyl-CoA acetyltransferase